MPIVEIEIVTQAGEYLSPDLPQRLADEIGKVFSSQPGSTWVKLRTLPRELYAENSVRLSDDPAPVFVAILKAHPGDAAVLQQEVSVLTPMIANLTNRPAHNVHILYLPAGAGRIAFGGSLR